MIVQGTCSFITRAPEILISQNASTLKAVLDYWIEAGDNIDLIDFHKSTTPPADETPPTERLRKELKPTTLKEANARAGETQ